MADQPGADLESSIRRCCEEAKFDGAATLLLRGYGPEILGFLCAMHPTETDAGEAFSEVAEAIWRGLPRFQWESSARTWAYAIAGNVTRTRRRDAARRGQRVAAASDSVVEQVAEQVRTQTKQYLRTDNRTRLQELRDELPEEDRMLLVLRIDRGLAWNDLARILLEQDGGKTTPNDATLTREAARLRKRFQMVKDRLRDKARREGLLD
jgi:RNA polymerase sigma-70 factor (ECF subfamily)